MPRAWLEQLVVSREQPRRSGAGVALSTLTHAGLIGALIVVPTLSQAQLPTPPDRTPMPAFRDIRPVPVSIVRPKPPANAPQARRHPHPPDAAGAPRRPAEVPVGEVLALAPDHGEAPPACLTNCDPAGASEIPEVGLPGMGVSNGEGDDAPVPVGGEVREPRKLAHVAPRYPELAQRARVEGVVILECVLDEQGRVQDARVLRGHPLLDPEALQAVRQWRYTPTLLNGVPVRVVMTVTVNFILHKR
jgi:protein TonB